MIMRDLTNGYMSYTKKDILGNSTGTTTLLYYTIYIIYLSLLYLM